MSLDSVVQVPTEETVQEYVDIFKNTDLKTALIAAGGLAGGLLLVRLVLKLVEKGLNRTSVPQTMHTMLRTMLRILLDLVVVLTVANYIGIPVTSFVALLGLFGLAVSLALQGVLSNLAGGFIILATHPFETGHFIEHDGITGTVQEIRMMHTRLATPDGKMIYIPNSSISSGRVINYSEAGKRRVDLTVSASYDSPPARVREAVMIAISRVEGILPDPAPVVALEKYGDSAIEYSVLVWSDGEDFITVKRALNEALYAAFADHGVEMTYPHLNVHMR
ncbi:MAG: mechanosensitive ion channel family protein [Clostridia bacterium]|nr:mechanosensitive ion channel family protein [Clostridia bacterium]